MGDTIDDFKALKQITREEREMAWERRGIALDQLRAAGFPARLISEEARHYRISIPNDGWFDFWPSTGRWSQSQRKAGAARALRGNGVDALILAIQGLRE